MPLMNGYEATREIRLKERKNLYSHTFICGLSAQADSETEQQCKAAGMDIYSN